MCDDNHSNSSFTLGIFLGAIIGAVVAIYVYKNNKSKVIQDLKKKLSQYFSDFATKPKSPAKKSVTIPKNVEVLDLKPAPKPKKPAKLFKK